jgi:rubrerythrin
MNSYSTNDLLNRLLILHERSLPMYLSYSGAEELDKHPKIAAVFQQIVEDHKRTADKLATLILENGGEVDRGKFPMDFTGYNDLSATFLLKKTIERQEKMIAMIEKIADLLSHAPYAQAAAKEALGEAKGHLENLQEAVREPAAA